MQNWKLTSCSSLKLPFSPLPLLPYLHLSLIVIIFLSWNLPSSVVITCPTICQCILSRQEMLCHKGKLVDITVDLYPSLKRLTLHSVTGLDVLSLRDLEPVKSTLIFLKIQDSSLKVKNFLWSIPHFCQLYWKFQDHAFINLLHDILDYFVFFKLELPIVFKVSYLEIALMTN